MLVSSHARLSLELQRGGQIVATGHLSCEDVFGVGDRVVIVGWPGVVRSVEPLLGENEARLVVQLTGDDTNDRGASNSAMASTKRHL